MNIETIKIQNFKGIKSYKGQVFGRDVWLIGKNGSGKTSFIDAVWLALNGKGVPPKPITSGEKKGLVEIELEGGFVARMKLSASGKQGVIFEVEDLNAENKDEQFVKAPRTWLNEKIGIIDFDVNKFFEMSDAKQVEYFCKITGIDVSEIDLQIEENIESRKQDKRDLAVLQGQTGFYNTEDAEKEPIDVIKLADEIKILEEAEREKKATWEAVTSGISTREQSARDKREQIERLTAEVGVLDQQIKDGYAWLDVPENKLLPNEDLDRKQTEFTNSTEINEAIQTAKKYKETDEKIEQLQAQITEANDNIEAERDKKGKIISEKINIEGLTYDTETGVFLFEGLPFDKNQINTASQVIAGLKIGASLLNEVKILRLDASLIDDENMKAIQAWSKSEGIELFVELVERSGKELKIVVEEVPAGE